MWCAGSPPPGRSNFPCCRRCSSDSWSKTNSIFWNMAQTRGWRHGVIAACAGLKRKSLINAFSWHSPPRHNAPWRPWYLLLMCGYMIYRSAGARLHLSSVRRDASSLRLHPVPPAWEDLRILTRAWMNPFSACPRRTAISLDGWDIRYV